jgi:hypothetical protein
LIIANCSRNIIICAGDGDGLALDLTERIRQLNEELLKEPLPPDVEDRERSIRFKETLVDFVAPTPEPEADVEDYLTNNETDAQLPDNSVPESPRDSHEHRDTTDHPAKFDSMAEQTLGPRSTEASPGAVNTEADTVTADHSADGSNEEQKTGVTDDVIPETPRISEAPASALESKAVAEDHPASATASASSVAHSRQAADNEVANSEKRGDNDAGKTEGDNEGKMFDEVTLIEQNGKFRIATSDDLIAIGAVKQRGRSARSPRQVDRLLLHPCPPTTPRSAMTRPQSVAKTAESVGPVELCRRGVRVSLHPHR